MLTSPHRMTRHTGHRLVAGPASEPVTLTEVRSLLRNPPTAENSFITSCIGQARLIFEAHTGIACINQSWRLTLDAWPFHETEWWDGLRQTAITEISGYGPNYITCPRYPLSSLSSLTTYSESRVSTSVTVEDYFFADTASFPGRAVLLDGAAWPTALASRNAIELVYVAGFGADATAVPEDIKRAIQSMAAFLWKNRGEGCSPAAVLQGSGALQIAGQYVTVRL